MVYVIPVIKQTYVKNIFFFKCSCISERTKSSDGEFYRQESKNNIICKYSKEVDKRYQLTFNTERKFLVIVWL